MFNFSVIVSMLWFLSKFICSSNKILNGNLIGINASRLTFENTQNVSYSIKSSYLKNLIDVLPVRIKLPNNKDIQDLKLTEKIKIISDYVVLIKVK